MAEPFVFHFKPASDGRPLLMYITDLSCMCGTCRHPQIQRFYHATDFHTLTLARLEELADKAPLKAGYECENCGDPVASQHVAHATLTIGFADESGLIRVFDDFADERRAYQLIEDRRLDPQELPGFEPASADGVVYDSLDDRTVEARLQRPTNLKVAWREFLDDFLEYGEEGWTRLGRGMVAYVTAGSLEALVDDSFKEDERLAEDEDLGDTFLIRLDDSVPGNLATHENPKQIVGAFRQWMPERILEAIDSGELTTGALVSVPAARRIVDRAFEVARLTATVEENDDVYYREITTPGELAYESDLSVESILRRAVHTGITTGDAARLTAEEVVGVLLRVWHPE